MIIFPKEKLRLFTFFCILAFASMNGFAAEKNNKLLISPTSFPLTIFQEHLIAKEMQNSMIWSASAPSGKQVYAVFRKTFTLSEKPIKASLRIFADTRYMLWVNGSYIERGPCRFDPKRPEYDILDISQYLNQDQNVIAVLVHYYAINNFKEWWLHCARMMHHKPGLTARLDVLMNDRSSITLLTDNSWKVNTKTRFLPSPGTYSSIFDNIDCRIEDGNWEGNEFDDSEWETPVLIDGNAWGILHLRSIPLLRERTIISLKIVQETVNGEQNDKVLLMADRLPIHMTGEHQVIIDVGSVVQGYSVLEFEADEGSILEVEYASRFFDTGRKPNIVNFGQDQQPRLNRYIARTGRQTYIGGDTYGFKYLVLRTKSGSINLHHIKVINRLYPFTRLGKFTSNDSLLNELWDVCVNTVEVCSEDAYVDCADRERAQWIADGYLMSYPVSRAALACPNGDGGYYYSDPRLLKNTLRHMGLSQLSDGRLQPMRPSDYPAEIKHGVIADYSCLWVQALRELYDRSGDEALVYELRHVVVRAMDYFLNRRTDQGLVEEMEFIYFNNPLAYKICEGASINAYIYRSLLDAAYLGKIINDKHTAERFTSAAERLYKDYNNYLWNADSGSYHGAIMAGEKTLPTGHAALLALFYDLVPKNRYRKALHFMLDNFEKENPYPYTYRFFLDVLYRQDTPTLDQLALDTIRRKWKHMIRYETRTTSEDWKGGSFIHESGAHPAYYLSSFVLGVRTEFEQDNLNLIIQPRLGDLNQAEGIVLTEYGKVPVSWHKESSRLDFQFEIPQGVAAKLSIPYIGEKVNLIVNNRTLIKDGSILEKNMRLGRRYIQFSVPSGKYTGTLSQN